MESTPPNSTQQVVSSEGGTPNNPTKKERKKRMKKHLWLWAIIVALLVAASPSLIDRWNAEQHSDQYEIIIPYEEIQIAANGTDYTIDELLQQFKSNGLDNVSLEPLTLKSLEENGIVTVDTEFELASLLRFTEFENQVDLTKRGYYISVPQDSNYQTLLEDTLQVGKVAFGDRQFYFLPKKHPYLLTSPLGFDPVAIETITNNDLDYTFRVPNDPDVEINKNIVNQVIQLKTDRVDGILPLGNQVIGAGHPNRDELIQALYHAGYYFYLVEEAQLKEGGAIGKITDYNVIRVHSINPNDTYVEGLGIKGQTERAARAVKERNIRSIFFHIKKEGDLDVNVENATAFLAGLEDKMPAKYSLGEPKLFEKVQVPAWALGLLLIASVLFVYIASEILMVKWLRYAAVGFVALLGAAYILLNKIIFLQAVALCIAVIAPSYAVIKTAKGTTKISGLLVQYVKAAAITIVGIALVVSLLNGNMFITKYEVFRGVIFVYALPIFALFLHAVVKHFDIDFRNGRDTMQKIIRLGNLNMKYWHVALLLVIAAVGFFYIGRTGNSGISFSFELAFRDWLEQTLYVRPRTKEFLIGFPLFVLGLYVLKSNPLLGRIFLIGGVIGFLSIMNTFNHLHIPLDLSIIRTVYGLVFGFIFGLIFIAIYKGVVRFWTPLKKRWL